MNSFTDQSESLFVPAFVGVPVLLVYTLADRNLNRLFRKLKPDLLLSIYSPLQHRRHLHNHLSIRRPSHWRLADSHHGSLVLALRSVQCLSQCISLSCSLVYSVCLACPDKPYRRANSYPASSHFIP